MFAVVASLPNRQGQLHAPTALPPGRKILIMASRHRPRRATRPGAAALELALLLPFLAFLFVIAIDWSRVFYYSLVVDNCARNGAVYSSDPYALVVSPY